MIVQIGAAGVVYTHRLTDLARDAINDDPARAAEQVMETIVEGQALQVTWIATDTEREINAYLVVPVDKVDFVRTLEDE